MFETNSVTRCTPQDKRGFTLIELLISMGVIFLVITVALVGLKSAKKAADRTTTLNALRQMMVAYNSYSAEYQGRLMPGYVDPDKVGTQIGDIVPPAKLANGVQLGTKDSAAYVWRLAPYLDYAWKTYMADYRSTRFEAVLLEEFGTGSGASNEAYGPGTVTGTKYGIARHPSFGLNSIYVGGDGGGSDAHGDPSRDPWDWDSSGALKRDPDTIAATRTSEVKNPNKLIVFAPTHFWRAADSEPPDVDQKMSVLLGYCELRPPFADYDRRTAEPGDPQWAVEAGTGPHAGQIIYSGSTKAGVPVDRFGGDKAPIAHLDGSVESEFILRLQVDMSRWSPFAPSTR
jgi:type II secretory pathway pseudopilin PulG